MSEDGLEEFCWNSRRWILFLALSHIPETCPDKREQLTECDSCEYYERRNPTSYFKQQWKALKSWSEDAPAKVSPVNGSLPENPSEKPKEDSTK